jgi:hypothetical protein
VKGKGMVKEASKKMPAELVEKFKSDKADKSGKSGVSGKSGKSGVSGKSGKSGVSGKSGKSELTSAQKKLPPALQKAIMNKKKADSESSLKIASIEKVNDNEVLLTLAQCKPMSREVEADMIIDSSDSEESEMSGHSGKSGKSGHSGMHKEECGSNMVMSDYSAKSAGAEPKFVKIANLTDKQKGHFRKYWGDVWPKEFIDAILSTQN